MTSDLKSLEVHVENSSYGLSARRLWEHTELGQINVFNQAISARRELNNAAAFIDILRLDGDTFSLAGLTLAELTAGKIPAIGTPQQIAVLLDCVKAKDGVAFVSVVANHLESCAMRQAVRNQQHQFLPSAQADDALGVPFMFSTLQRRLQSMGKSKAGAGQWLKTIENFQKNGMRAEELECSGLLPDLSPPYDDAEQFTATEMANLCDFKSLRLSVISSQTFSRLLAGSTV